MKHYKGYFPLFDYKENRFYLFVWYKDVSIIQNVLANFGILIKKDKK